MKGTCYTAAVRLEALPLTAASALGVIAHSLDGGSVNVFDGSLRYLYAEGPGLSAAGLSPELVVGRTLHDLFPPAEVALVEPHYRRALAGESVRFDLPVFGRVYAVVASPLTDGVILVVVRDVTTERASAADQEQEHRFIATVCHEIRQPLAPLRFAVESLKKGCVEAASHLPRIERQI